MNYELPEHLASKVINNPDVLLRNYNSMYCLEVIPEHIHIQRYGRVCSRLMKIVLQIDQSCASGGGFAKTSTEVLPRELTSW